MSTIALILTLLFTSLVTVGLRWWFYIRRRSTTRKLTLKELITSVRKEDGERIELIDIRKETPEEYTLHHSRGVQEAITICIALSCLFFSLISPGMLLPWLILIALMPLVWACWRLFRPLSKADLQEVYCLSGTPKRWGLFGESKQSQMNNNISLGMIDLIYPSHWGSRLTHDLDKKTQIDIYVNHQVIRQGSHLSLHDEAQRFPLQRWGRNLILMVGSLLILIMLLLYVPLSLSLKLSVVWFQGAQSWHVTDIEALRKIPLHIGDILSVQGTGMCYVPPSSKHPNYVVFTPFDCSGIYWNSVAPLAQPESAIIEKVATLMNTIKRQLHPQENKGISGNQQSTAKMKKSSMTRLDDFTDIILKTQALCEKASDCIWLKNVLINLGHAKNWTVLVEAACSGRLAQVNVLLPPVKVEALQRLVNIIISSYVHREIHRATVALNSPSPGGFLITNSEGKQWVEHTPPLVPLFDYSALEQWQELQRLSRQLLNTYFKAEGIITDIVTDTQGTQHISLHSKPDMITIIRYQGTSLLLLVVISCLVINTVLFIRRVGKNRYRMKNIQHYYTRCFDHTETFSNK